MFLIRMALTCILVLALQAGEPLPAPMLDLDAAWRTVGEATATPAPTPGQRRNLLMAMAGIAMLGDPAEEGLDPLWQARAWRLRQTVRTDAGAPLPDRVAEWWWRALDGWTAEVVAAIDALPVADRPAELRWLRQWCTLDWRQAPAAGDPPIAWLAWLRATAFAHGERALQKARLPPAVAGSLVASAMLHHSTVFPSRESAVWFDLALDQVARLARTAGLPPAAQALAAAAAADQRESGERLVASLRFLDAFPPPAPPDRDQRDALADRAASIRLHLQLGARVRHRFLDVYLGDPEGALALAGPLVAAYPDEVLAVILGHRKVGQAHSDAAILRILGQALADDPARPCPDSILSIGVAWTASSWKVPGSEGLVARHVARWQKTRIDAQGRATFAGIGGLLAPLMEPNGTALEALSAAALTADPWSRELLGFWYGRDHQHTLPAERLVAAADMLVKDMPWHLDAMGNLALRLETAQEHAKALALLDIIHADDPGCGWMHNRCNLLRKSGKTEAAIAAYREYLGLATTFDRIDAGRQLAKLLEDSGDLAGAEAAFTDAAQSWQQGAIEDYARFLARRERWAEAATWWRNSAGRYASENARVQAADCLLRADPEDVNAAIAMLETGGHASRLNRDTTDELLRIMDTLMAVGAERGLFHLVMARATSVDGKLRYLRAVSAMDTGHLLLAEDDLDWLGRDVYASSSWNTAEAATIIVRATLASGLWGRKPRIFEEMRTFSAKDPGPDAGPALQWLGGSLSKDDEAAAVAGGHDGLLRLCWAWSALAHGDLALSIAHLQPLVDRPTRDPWRGSARCLLATLQAAPTADLVRLAARAHGDVPLPKPPAAQPPPAAQVRQQP